MELLWVGWFVFGLIVGVMIGVKGKSDLDSDIRIYHPSRNREHRSMDRVKEGDKE